MTCPFCHCNVPDFCPFSLCPQCGQPLESRYIGNGPERKDVRRE